MKEKHNPFLRLTIRKKLLIGTLVVTLVVLLVTSITFFFTASRMMREQSAKQSAGVVHELLLNLDHYFEKVENSFDYISNNNQVQDELRSGAPFHSDGSELYTYYSRAGQIRRLLLQGYTSVYMNGIQLYGYNGANHILSGEEGILISDQEMIVKKAEEARGRCVYYSASSENGLVYIAKQVKDALTTEPLGILMATIKVSYLEKMTQSARTSLDGQVFLLDDDDRVILCSMEELPEGILEERIGNVGSRSMYLEGKRYNYLYQVSTETNFTLGCLVPESFLNQNALLLRRNLAILLLISILLCALLSSILARGILRPIAETGRAMEQFAHGDFTVRLPEHRKDEIGAMNVVFNHTIQEIERLLTQVVEMETSNKDMEFQALQAQINPHFLYNVMDTINWMARKNGEENICRMVTAVSSLMRASLSNKKSSILLEEEMKYVQDYLYIQETRFGSKLTHYIELEDELMQVEVPKFTIQTLVENAVVHGIENSTEDCVLTVTGEMQGDIAVLTVEDDGVGIPEEKLSELNKEEDRREGNDQHARLGVYAVRKRLKYLYGEEASMEIDSTEGQGTSVTLKIPILAQKKIIELHET